MKHARNLIIIFVILIAGVIFWATRPDVAELPIEATEGPSPEITAGKPQRIPTVEIADVDRWQDGQMPTAPDGYKVELYADGLDHPRGLFRLPNGDVLVAEANRPEGSGGGGIVGWIQGLLFKKAGAGGASANRITLLRDSDGDGKVDERHVFAEGLDSPFGMALANGNFFVANTGAVRWWPYEEGQTRLDGEGKVLLNLADNQPNMHWTRGLLAAEDGSSLFISVGSNSNIQENGREAEVGRARIIEYDFGENEQSNYAIGLRNPVGMDFNPWDGRVWAVVNERDMYGSDMVPDYLAMIPEASDFGWPHHYWGGYTDERVQPPDPESRQYEERPDYALGAHTAPLGLLFTDELNLGGPFARGAFIARHGSWNRVPPSGYDVVFVRFNERGRPVGKPITFLSGFLSEDRDNARGRPTMLAADATGALLVSDDVGNRIWRVSRVAESSPAGRPAESTPAR